ncbi:MAG: hypothetical protein D3910_04710 [Candidatus Electrothrix sp. ATG2]|nr:hypothetical protein [Candidatus Electrothrix sp. ATG2]
MDQGVKPYTLAYGRAGLEGARSQVDRLLQAVDPLSEKKLVALGGAYCRGGCCGDYGFEIVSGDEWGRGFWGCVRMNGARGAPCRTQSN